MNTYPRPSVVHYGTRDDPILRWALLQEWGSRCYWCDDLLSLATSEIDHIIPRRTSAQELVRLVGQYDLPQNFHKHQPGNLAPICTRCNKKKRDGEHLNAPVVHNLLLKARNLEPKVIARFHDYKRSLVIGPRLLHAADMDLSSPRTRHEFLAFAPAVVQTLALLDEAQADFFVHRNLVFYPDGEPLWASFTLNAHDRARWTWVEEICGRAWDNLLDSGIQELVSHSAAIVEEAILDYCGPTVGLTVAITERVATLKIVDLGRDHSRIICRVSGDLQSHYGTYLIDHEGPDGTIEISDLGPAVRLGTPFDLSVFWDFAAEPADPTDTDLQIKNVTLEIGISQPGLG